MPATSVPSNIIASGEVSSAPSVEVVKIITTEVSPASTQESAPPPGLFKVEEKPLEEGSSYKGVPWGCDFIQFKQMKNFSGILSEISAAFLSTSDDNDLALILGAPLSAKGADGGQRVLFEFVPQRFASAYYPPEDVYYIFYNGKFAMVFSRLIESNYDLYRDNLYKKYRKSGNVSFKFQPTTSKKCYLEAIKFEKGKTYAFLIKSRIDEKKKSSLSVKLLFASSDIFAQIQRDISSNVEQGIHSQNIKAKESLEIDLNKIE
jgi:hypothetical protein